MNRRLFLAAASAAILIGCAPSASLAAQSFEPTRFSVEVKGSGPDVILIPGLTAPRSIWNGIVAAVPGYRYHLVQVAGFAGDPARGNAKGEILEPLTDEIARYIAANRLDRPALVGHSMGGTLAMKLAAAHPAKVGKLMVVDMLPAPAGLIGSNAAAIRPLADSLRNVLTGSPGGRRLLDSLIGSFGGGGAAPASDSDVVARAMHELALSDLTPVLGRIKAPMSVVYAVPPAEEGGDPARAARTYAAAYSGAEGAELIPVANSGHMIMFDQPQAFRTALKRFLAR